MALVNGGIALQKVAITSVVLIKCSLEIKSSIYVIKKMHDLYTELNSKLVLNNPHESFKFKSTFLKCSSRCQHDFSYIHDIKGQI